MQTCGAWIANRYKERPNIVWKLGGDQGTSPNTFSTAQRDVQQAMINGMPSVSGQKSVHFAAEWGSESIGTDQPDFGRYMTLNGAYSHSAQTATQMRRAYADPIRTMPTFRVRTTKRHQTARGSTRPRCSQPDATSGAPVGAVRLARVLDHDQAVALGDRQDRVHVRALAIQVHRNDGLGLAESRCFPERREVDGFSIAPHLASHRQAGGLDELDDPQAQLPVGHVHSALTRSRMSAPIDL